MKKSGLKKLEEKIDSQSYRVEQFGLDIRDLAELNSYINYKMVDELKKAKYLDLYGFD